MRQGRPMQPISRRRTSTLALLAAGALVLGSAGPAPAEEPDGLGQLRTRPQQPRREALGLGGRQHGAGERGTRRRRRPGDRVDRARQGPALPRPRPRRGVRQHPEGRSRLPRRARHLPVRGRGLRRRSPVEDPRRPQEERPAGSRRGAPRRARRDRLPAGHDHRRVPGRRRRHQRAVRVELPARRRRAGRGHLVRRPERRAGPDLRRGRGCRAGARPRGGGRRRHGVHPPARLQRPARRADG